MHIKKIKIEKFKSFYDPVEIDFDKVRGFWKISGTVGSGKTSIGEAIIFGLFGTVGGKSNSDLISWGEKHGLIELWVESKGKSLYIKREINSYGQSPIYIEVNGEELIFSNKLDAQRQLEQEYYDASKMTIELLCIISFNNFKSLATLNSMDTKKFLDQVLGFKILTQYADICKELRNDVLKDIDNINNRISSIELNIKSLEDISNTELIEGDMEYIKKDIKNNNNILTELKENYNSTINSLKENKRNLELQSNTITVLGKNKQKEISFIEKGICPTCGAAIDQSQLDTKKQERIVLLDQYNRLAKDIKAVDSEIHNIQEKYNSDAYDIQETINSSKDLLNRLKEQEKRKSINITYIDQFKEQVKQYKEDLEKQQLEDVQWDSLYNIISNDIRIKILSSFIPVLNNNILKYSQRLHLPYIVKFDANFKCSIELCGTQQVVPTSSLSTGQLKTVDAIIILGVLGTIINSQGCNIIFLDELFSNLDVDLRNEMCEVLKENIQDDDTMFIISHTEFDDSIFDGIINMKLNQKGQFERHTTMHIRYT